MTRRRLAADDQAPPPEQPKAQLRCPVHHCLLERGLGPQGSTAWCPDAGEYSVAASCPFVCPHCRQPLDWSGGCDACHGTYSGGRGTWSFPGDRYDRFDDNGKPIGDGMHWVKTDGPRPACPPAQNVEGIRAIQRILANSTLATKINRVVKQ